MVASSSFRKSAWNITSAKYVSKQIQTTTSKQYVLEQQIAKLQSTTTLTTALRVKSLLKQFRPRLKYK